LLPNQEQGQDRGKMDNIFKNQSAESIFYRRKNRIFAYVLAETSRKRKGGEIAQKAKTGKDRQKNRKMKNLPGLRLFCIVFNEV